MLRSSAFTVVLFTLALAGCGGPMTDVSLEKVATQSLGLDVSTVENAHGVTGSYSPLGNIGDLRATNAFFKDMGNTGRTCESCHGEQGGWTPSASQELWDSTAGNDPLFLFTHDIGRCPDSEVDPVGARRIAMSPALERGNARGGVTIRDTFEFAATAVQDPYGCGSTLTSFFSYREPNPVNSLSQKISATWTGGPHPDMRAALKGFMIGATRFHGLTSYTPTEEEQNEGADFMLNLFAAQIEDSVAGRLDADGARGGPVHLADQEWYPGINHASTGDVTKKVFDIYDAWLDIDPETASNAQEREMLEKRRLIAEGQEIFNFGGANANGRACSSCHNSPNVGGHSVFRLIDIGIVDKADKDLPSVTLRNKETGEERTVTNLGRAASTGLWSDIGRMKVPMLRGLAQRAPYFSSGQANTLRDVVHHYDERFSLNLSEREVTALSAFLSAL